MSEEKNTPTVEEAPDPATPEAYKQFASKQEHDEYINTVIEDRLKRKDQKLEEDKERIEREAREKALKDNEDWKALAQTHAETIAKHEKKIEGLQAQVQQQAEVEDRNKGLETRLRGIIKPRLEQVPELFRPFVESMDVETQAEWFEINADKLDDTPAEDDDPKAETLVGIVGKRPAGQPPTGAPAAGGPDKQKAEEAKQGQRQLGISRI